MYRDFTEDEKQKLLGYVQDDADKNAGFNGGIVDFFADIAHYSDLDINDYVTNIDDYHKKLIDAEDMTADNIEELFEAVHDVDDDTVADVTMVKRMLELLDSSFDSLQECITIGDSINTNKPLALSSEDYQEKVNDEVYVVDAVSIAEIINECNEGNYENAQAYVDKEVEELTRNVLLFGDGSTQNDDKTRQELVVDIYRLMDTDSAEKFDTLFNSGNVPVDQFDQYNIMYLVYTADEPYRSIYLNSLGKYELGNITLTGGSFYTSGGNSDIEYADANTVNLNYSETMFDDPRGPYTTFFHECGHAIDFNVAYDIGSYSSSYDWGSNYSIILDDVYDRLKTEINNYMASDPRYMYIPESTRNDMCFNVLTSILNDGETSYLSTSEIDLLEEIQAKMNNDLSQTGTSTFTSDGSGAAVYECPSDIYGGTTNNVVVGNYSHSIFNDDNSNGVWDSGESATHYWYNSFGSHTNAQEQEMWAEYYSYNMTGNEEALNAIATYLPNTTVQYEQMAQDMNERGF